jgi:hypothetical protein
MNTQSAARTMDKQYSLDSIPELAQSSMTSLVDLTASGVMEKIPQMTKTLNS